MTGDRWDIVIDRVVVHGVGPGPHDAGEIRRLVDRAIGERLRTAALPAGRMMRLGVDVTSPGLRHGGGPAIASAVARGVVKAIGRGRHV